MSQLFTQGIIPGSQAYIKTTGDLTLSVSSAGSDTPSTARTLYLEAGDYSATPFLTLQAAVNSVPNHTDYTITIGVGAGTFATWKMPGFEGSGDIHITGSTALATLTTGANTGTAGAGTTVDGSTGKLTLNKPTAAANWTSNNLRGKIMLVTGGAGLPTTPGAFSFFMLASNTTTAATAYYGSTVLASGSDEDAWLSVDNTTTFQIVNPSTIIDPGSVGSGDPVMELENILPTLVISKLSMSSGGNNFGSVWSIYTSNSVTFAACKFDTSADQYVQVFQLEEMPGFSMIGTYIYGATSNAGDITNTTDTILSSFGNVTDHGGGNVITSAPFVYSAGNNFVNLVGGDGYAWEIQSCITFQDYNSVYTTTSQDCYSFALCAATLSGISVSGITGYGLRIGSLATVNADNKNITGVAGDILLKDTGVSYSGMATNDITTRRLAEFVYVGP